MSDGPHTRPEPTPRERIVDAASAEFAEHGFAGARVDAIAARAGLNKAMLYYHVGDKRALYTAVLMRNFDRVATALAGAASSGTTVCDRLRAVITAIIGMIRDNPEHPRIVLREVASGAANLPPEVLGRMLEVVAIVRELLEEGMGSGELRTTDPMLTHLTVVGAVLFLTSIAPLRERAAALAAERTMPDPGVDLAAFLSDLLLYGVAADPTRGGSA